MVTLVPGTYQSRLLEALAIRLFCVGLKMCTLSLWFLECKAKCGNHRMNIMRLFCNQYDCKAVRFKSLSDEAFHILEHLFISPYRVKITDACMNLQLPFRKRFTVTVPSSANT